MKKILYGVCGIGNGHTQRQLPLIEYFSKENQIVIFAYDVSFSFFSNYFKGNSLVTVLEVAVPFYVGNRDGIDFEATDKLSSNKKDYNSINGNALVSLNRIIGIPDIVITDYEPISASVAYKHRVPLVTIDQQSKYLMGKFPIELYGQTYADEIERLKMFFPTATTRIACSFFDVMKKKDGENVLIFSPIIKDSVLNTKNNPKDSPSLLVYFSSQKEFSQNLDEIILIFLKMYKVQFHIFISGIGNFKDYENVHFYKHGDANFSQVLKDCSGIISTAGHTLLSEAMYLNIPVYAIPLPVYEQQMNAEIISKNRFGIRSDTINEQDLDIFMENISLFRDSIRQDTKVLLRGSSKDKIIAIIENIFISS